MKLKLHRKEQWDLNCKPLLCLHIHRTDESVRVFCLWSHGLQIGNAYFLWRWGRVTTK